MYNLYKLNSNHIKDVTTFVNSTHTAKYYYVGLTGGDYTYNAATATFTEVPGTEPPNSGQYNLVSGLPTKRSIPNMAVTIDVPCKLRTIGIMINNDFKTMANITHTLMRFVPYNNTYSLHKYVLSSNVEQPDSQTINMYNLSAPEEINVGSDNIRVSGTRNYNTVRLPLGARESVDTSISIEFNNEGELIDYSFEATKLEKHGV
jgi:hypothetical protein